MAARQRELTVGVDCPQEMDSPEEALLERIHVLHAQLNDQLRLTPEYERVSAEIRDLSKTYCHLVDAKRGVQQRDPQRPRD